MNGILIVDKPQGWTSHDVVAKLRGICRERRIGHAGTLDPMATGVLVVFLGRATRAVELFENDDKEYEAVMRLGTVTNTQDMTGEIIETNRVLVTVEDLQAVLKKHTGPQSQIPPMYSAVKIGGKKLYELARKGQSVERKPRSITVFEMELISFQGTDAKIRVHCSKGTYIRTLCHDIGTDLGCGGCLASLRRTKSGRFSLTDCVTLEQLTRTSDGMTSLVRPVDSLFDDLPAIKLNDQWTFRCKNGGVIPVPERPDGQYRVYGTDGEFLMLGSVRNGTLKTIKSFFEVK